MDKFRKAASLFTGASKPETPMKVNKLYKAAILLTGAGKTDGSEILETASMIFALHQHNIKVSAFAFDRPLMDNRNHISGKLEVPMRNALVESARIMRGQVEEMGKLDPLEFDMLLIPGGFGVAKNFCNFASEGLNMKIDERIEEIITAFHQNGKPIGACCIAPVLLAKAISGVTVTLGKTGKDFPFGGSIEAAIGWGANCEMKDIGEVAVDKKNKVVTTPAFMKDSQDWYPVLTGNQKVIESLLDLL